MDIEQIKERIKKHPEIHINTLNYIAQIEHEVATQKLYMSNINERNEPGY